VTALAVFVQISRNYKTFSKEQFEKILLNISGTAK
jgi:hypothetical protein